MNRPAYRGGEGQLKKKKENEENNGNRLTEMQLTDPASPRTGLGENDFKTLEYPKR